MYILYLHSIKSVLILQIKHCQLIILKMLFTIPSMFVRLGEITNILSAILLQILIMGLLIYFMKFLIQFYIGYNRILREQQNENQNHQIPQLNMMKVNIPFTFKLQENACSVYREVGCKISSQVNYCMFVYWGVSIKELHHSIWRPWFLMIRDIKLGKLLPEQCYQQVGMQYSSPLHSDKLVRLKNPCDKLKLGSPPRSYYPLVVILTTDDDVVGQPHQTVMLVNVVHIKDVVCTLPTTLIAQYIKQANGQLSSLQPLYFTSPPEPVGTYEPLCVVCQSLPLSRALLPCRHTCICAYCFARIETCPLCRSQIQSFFVIHNEDYMQHVITENRMPLVRKLTFWWNNVFHRV